MTATAIRPVKLANLTTAVERAAAYSAFRKEHKPTPSAAQWRKLMKVITVSAGYKTTPYLVVPTLLPVWTKAYKAAQKGHTPGTPVVIPAPKPKASTKAKAEAAPAQMPALPAGTTFRVNADGTFTIV